MHINDKYAAHDAVIFHVRNNKELFTHKFFVLKRANKYDICMINLIYL